MSKCMMCQNDEDLRDLYERQEEEEKITDMEISEETRQKIKEMKSFSFYLIVTPIILFLLLVLIFVF